MIDLELLIRTGTVTSPGRSGDRPPTPAPCPGHGIDDPGLRERFKVLVAGCLPDLKVVLRRLSAIVRMPVSGSGADSRISGGFIREMQNLRTSLSPGFVRDCPQ